MAVASKRLIALALLLLGGLNASDYQRAEISARTLAPVAGNLQVSGARIVSLIPSATEMLFAMGAGPQVVAVSSYDTFPPDVKTLPKVGALLDPDIERILSLKPTLVVTYVSQTTLENQLHRAGIRTFSYRHTGVAGIMQTLRDLGTAAGHAAQADKAAHDLQAQLDVVAAKVRGRPRPRTIVVFGRQPGSLQQIYVSGGTGFVHDILTIAGGANVLADTALESVQPSQEALLRLAPDVIVEMRASAPTRDADTGLERAAWSKLASVPAVRTGRIYFLSGEYFLVPGPRLGIAADALARVLHPDAFR